MKPSTADALALLLAGVAILASIWVAEAVLERLPHIEDEIAFLWEANVIAEGKASLSSPIYPRSFLVPFVVDYQGLRFGKYPPGWPATLSLGVRAGAGWLVNPLLAGLAAWLVYRLGSRLAGRGVGVLAEALTVSSPFFLMLSGSLMGHNLSLVLACAFWLAWSDLFLPARNGERPGRLPPLLLILVAGGSLGLLGLTRPLTAVGVALPAGLHGVWLVLRADQTRRARVLAIGALALALSSLLLLWQASLTGDPLLNPYTLWWPYDRIGFGPGHGHTTSGHNLHWAWINTRHSLRAGLHDLFGWPYLSWLFLPAGLWALRKDRTAWMLVGAFPSLVLVYALYWIGSWLFGPRYYFEALPGLAITSAAGIAWAAGWMQSRARLVRLRRAAVALVLGLLVGLNLAVYIPLRLGGLRGLYGISRAHLESFRSLVPERALVVVHPAEIWTEYGTLLTLAPPFRRSDLLLAYSRGPQRDLEVEQAFPSYPAFHYYGDDPGHLHTEPR